MVQPTIAWYIKKHYELLIFRVCLCNPFTNICNMPTNLPLTIATKINRTSGALAISKAVEILF